MEQYLSLFEDAVKKQAELVGYEIAHDQARKAGLGVTKDGHIASCTGHPQVVLLRLIRFFTAGGNLAALMAATPLINAILKDTTEQAEKNPVKQETPA
jgi:hypothetical protein